MWLGCLAAAAEEVAGEWLRKQRLDMAVYSMFVATMFLFLIVVVLCNALD